jgi:hypothetical protein
MKMEICLSTPSVRLSTLGSHLNIDSEVSAETSGRFVDSTLRSFVIEKAEQGLTASQIRAKMLLDRDLFRGKVCLTLTCVQDLVTRHRKAYMLDNNHLDTVAALLEDKIYSSSTGDHDPFIFGCSLQLNGLPVIGDGSDDDRFYVGFTTKSLLQRFGMASAGNRPTLVHADCTFKLTTTNFPLMTIGISDCNGTFHLLGVALVSQRDGDMWEQAFRGLSEAYTTVTGEDMLPTFMMSDADNAQLNGCRAVFPDSTPLMCYFHVVKNCKDHLGGISTRKSARIMGDIARIHYSRSVPEMSSVYEQSVSSWLSDSETSSFARYFQAQWGSPPFHRWQQAHLPRAYSSTNNPCEYYNKDIKRTYTRRRKEKVPVVVGILLSVVEKESREERPITFSPGVSKRIKARYNSLKRAGLLTLVRVRGSTHVLVKQSPEEEAIEIPASETQSAEVLEGIWRDRTKRFEHYGMPDEGWKVHVDARTCECLLFNKVGCCVHLVHAAEVLNKSLPGSAAPRRRFVNRAVRGASASANVDLTGGRASQRLSQQRTGRPRTVTPALSL